MLDLRSSIINRVSCLSQYEDSLQWPVKFSTTVPMAFSHREERSSAAGNGEVMLMESGIPVLMLGQALNTVLYTKKSIIDVIYGS